MSEIKVENGKLELTKAETGDEYRFEQKALEGLAKTEVFGIPVGAAAGGLLTVSAFDALRGLLAGAIPKLPQWVIPAIGAWVVSTKTVKGFMGTTASNAAGLILTADAIQAIYNVRGLVSGRVGGVKLEQTMRGKVKTEGNGHKEITSIEEYNRVMGLSK